MFLLNCFAGRSLALLGPLAVAHLVAPATYGAIELALSVGLLLGPALALGVPSATPQLLLIHRDERVPDRLALAVL
ncbi:MAG: hypothetical protein KDD75_20235, partial [Caldilineaceae bacterium]|nr:hypothetical protein [Caldilineaceae bacterium]